MSWKLAVRVFQRILIATGGCDCCSFGIAEARVVKAARRRGGEEVEGADCNGCVRCAAAVAGGCTGGAGCGGGGVWVGCGYCGGGCAGALLGLNLAEQKF